MAKEVRTPQYKQRIVENKMVYNRKDEDRKDEEKWTPTKGLFQMLDKDNTI